MRVRSLQTNATPNMNTSPFLTSSSFAALLTVQLIAAEPFDPLRLTHHPVEPLAEAVALTLDPGAEEFSGEVRIDLLVHESTSSFRLHAEDLVLEALTLVSIASADATTLTATTGELGLTTLTAPRPLAPGPYQLQVEYRARFRRDGVALYKTVHNGRPYLFTQMEARFARLAFPCWDEPAFKIPWQITLRIPAPLSAFSNNAVAIETREGEWKTVSFGRTPPMPSYLVALAVGDFETMTVPGLPVPGRIIATAGQIDLAAGMAAESGGLLRELERYFGIPYPYAKLDQVAVPEFTFGAMENAGLITYRDDIALLDPNNTSFDQGRRRASIVAHEMAHLWFGDLVTMEWWDDLWLNESFASWMSGRVLTALHPEMRARLNSLGGTHRAMAIDALPSVRPIRRTISAAEDPVTLVDTLTYQKGQAVLEMIESWIGPEAFRTALRTYFESHRWGNTHADDLWAAFESAGGEEVAALAASFITQPGIPLVTVERFDGNRIRLRQQRFNPTGAILGHGTATQTWRVPIVFKYPRGNEIVEQRVLLSQPEQVISLAGLQSTSWIYPNADESGYYRWEVPMDDHARLVARAVSTLSARERLGLVDNSGALLEAGKLSGDDFMAALASLAADPVAEVALKVASAISGVRDIYLSSEDRAPYAAFCEAVLQPVLHRIGLQPQAGESSEVAQLRAALLRILGDEPADEEVLAFANDLTARVLRDPASMDAELASTVLQIAARRGDATLYNAIEQAYLSARDPNLRGMFLRTLGNFPAPALRDRALAFALGPEVNSTQTMMIPRQIAGIDEQQRASVIAWLMAHYDALAAKVPSVHAGGFIGLADGNDLTLFEKARTFLLAPERTNSLAEKNAREVGDRVALHATLRQRERASILAFLNEQAPPRN